MNNAKPPPSKLLSRITEALIHTRTGAMLLNFPPIAFVLERVARQHIEQSGMLQAVKEIQQDRVAYGDLNSTLNAIAIDVVETLDYEAAMVAPYEADGALPLRAWHTKVPRETVLQWEAEIAMLSGDRPISLTNPEIARVYVNRDSDALNLGVRASKARHPIMSDDLYDLFRPITPESTRPFVKGVQDALKVKQVIAVPFFIETSVDGRVDLELVGNLFALASGRLSVRDQQALQAFGRQAAAAILSERRRAYVEATLSLIFDIQTSFQDESQILQRIVDGVVRSLNYVGAMVAIYNPDDGSLPVRAWHTIMPSRQVLDWEAQIAALSPNHPVSLTNPDIARVYVNRPEYKENLSAQAFSTRDICTSNDLFDLFRPIAPESTRPIVRGIQAALGVKQVVAIPFFQRSGDGSTSNGEFIGNLFVLSHSEHLDSVERQVLKAFGQQAAEGIRNAQLYRDSQELYRQAENRRRAAEIFGKMAFNASASVHELKNRVGVVRGFLQIVPGIMDDKEISEPIFRNLDQMADMLDNLHEPFHIVPDTMVSIDSCVRRATRRVDGSYDYDVPIKLELNGKLPEIYAAQDMITEVFKVLIKNALEAVSVAEKGEHGRVLVTTQLHDSEMIEIAINDNGTGIRREDESRIFEMRWSTKSSGLGFGLFWTKDYVEGIGGTINVKTVYGEGTTFIVRLPVNRPDQIRAAADEQA